MKHPSSRLYFVAATLGLVILANPWPAGAVSPGKLQPFSLIAPSQDQPLPEPPPTPRNLPLLLPAMEAGLVPADRLQNLLQASPRDLDAALRTLSENKISNDCLEPPRLGRPSKPDSLDVLHYDIDILEVDEDNKYVRVSTVVTVKTEKLLTAFDLDLAKPRALDVHIKLPGHTEFLPAAFTHRDSVLHIGPFTAVAKGQELTVRIESEGQDDDCLSIKGITSGAVFTTAGVHTFSEPTYARYWYPCHDVPWDRATYTLTLTVPEGRVPSAAGLLTPFSGEPNRLTWSIPDPVPPYLVAFYLGDYVKLSDVSPGGVPLEYYVYPQLVEKAQADFVNVPDMMEFFSSLYPYPNPRYAMTLGFFGGGMEHQMNSLISDNAIRGNRSFESLFSHELAHMWWGNLVTMDVWGDIWLNEGFATYSEWMYSEHRYGWQSRLDAVTLVDSVYISRADDPESPIPDHAILPPPIDNIFSYIVYQKGARVLDMLRGVSRLRLMGPVPRSPAERESAAREGDERFFKIFGEWAAAHRFQNATTQQFQALAENALGENLDWFVNAWLRGRAYPRYQYDYIQFAGPRGAIVQAELRQVSNPGPVLEGMPLHVRYRSEAQVLDAVVPLTGERTKWSVSLPPGDWTMELDPDDWLLEASDYSPFFPRFRAFAPNPNPSSSGFTLGGVVGSEPSNPGLLEIYDLSGRLVRSIDMGPISPGAFQTTWDGHRDDGRRVPAGVYFARMSVGLLSEVQRLVVLP